MNTVHVSGLWNLYDCQAQLSTVTHVCHHKKVPSFLHVFVSRWIKLLLNMWCIDWIAWYLQPIQTSTTNDRHIALADHFVFLWVLVWSLAIVQHVCLSLFAWVSTNQWATKNSSTLTLHPGYALWDIPLFFQIEAKYLTCREQLQAKQLRQWLKLMKTLYMLCYAQVDWYKNTSHKDCRQTRCSVVHNLGPALFMLMWKDIHVLCCGFLLISSKC